MKKSEYKINFFGHHGYYVTFNKPIIPVHKRNDYHLAIDNILRGKNRNTALFPTQAEAEKFMKTYEHKFNFDMKALAKAVKKTR